ncbi:MULTISPECIES: protease modulator HflC [Oleiagrimonas]|uniref:Protein HflC n=1 Tax=Oleiagrimonas citrea TaxID=1665687 RepID=A0A846ZMX6_9GAMM|nr:protease modulator HflC [Oleiagrimonas sp. MCCC 1A03011]NKZ38791.1 protease modulator HflC [Oleiagrimonas citrea]RAP59222.1 protease modulator HflC [Oleiagrimonas sp. MCCC 1A03011]
MKIASAIVAILIVLGVWSSAFVVREGQTAIVLQFGRIERTNDQPGLHFKWPFVQQVMRFDARIQTLDAQPERYFTLEKKSVKVDFYVKWRIAKNTTYYLATAGDLTQARQRLSPIIKDALRFEVNARPLDELISGGRKDITKRVRELADKSTRKSLGIEVVDVRIKQIDLPSEVSDSVYKRMRAERTKLANELRSTGKEAGEKIRADADRQRQVLIADAHRDAAKVRGEGDATAAQIYAKTYSQDPKFYDFYRSLQAYRHAFANGKGVLVLKSDSNFMRFFDNQDGNKR